MPPPLTLHQSPAARGTWQVTYAQEVQAEARQGARGAAGGNMQQQQARAGPKQLCSRN